MRWQLQRRLASLDDDVAVLCFGRIDEESGDRWYVGRRHIEDGDGTPVVVDWRAGVATPFYRATLADPFGLERRRRFVFSARELDRRVRGGLLRSRLARGLGRRARSAARRARAGRAPARCATSSRRSRPNRTRSSARRSRRASSCRAVRAPGKTAVGLHRAAFLLYEHRVRLAREGVLVVGPNPVFLRYISQVLPSLGETSATQTTVDGLLALRFRIVGRGSRPRSPRSRATRGSPRSIARGAADAIRVPADGVTLRFRTRRADDLAADDVRALVDDARGGATRRSRRNANGSGSRWCGARTTATRAASRSSSTSTTSASRCSPTPQSRKAIDGCWRSVSPVALVRSLLTQRAFLARAATGVLIGRRAGAAAAAASRSRATRGRPTTCRSSTRRSRS